MCKMKPMEKPRQGRFFELMGVLSLLWSMNAEELSAPEDYSFFEEPANEY